MPWRLGRPTGAASVCSAASASSSCSSPSDCSKAASSCALMPSNGPSEVAMPCCRAADLTSNSNSPFNWSRSTGGGAGSRSFAPVLPRSDLPGIASVDDRCHTCESTPTHKQIILVGGTRGDDSSHARTCLEIRGCSRGDVSGVRQRGGWAGIMYADAPVPWAACSAQRPIFSGLLLRLEEHLCSRGRRKYDCCRCTDKEEQLSHEWHWQRCRPLAREAEGHPQEPSRRGGRV